MPSRASRSTRSPSPPARASRPRRRPPPWPWSTTIISRGPRRTVGGARCLPASPNRFDGILPSVPRRCVLEARAANQGILGGPAGRLGALHLARIGGGDRADVVHGPLGHLEQAVQVRLGAIHRPPPLPRLLPPPP